MTVGAFEPLSRPVVRVTECITKSTRVRRGGPVGLLLVTDATRRDLAARIRFARWRVARVAVAVRGEVRRNRKPGASIYGRAVATGTNIRRARGAGVVLGVIELDVERFVETCRKILERRVVALSIGMTDQAHWNRRRRELTAMAIGAGFMTGKARRDVVVGAFVTRVAGDRTMFRARVEKLGVISLGTLGHR